MVANHLALECLPELVQRRALFDIHGSASQHCGQTASHGRVRIRAAFRVCQRYWSLDGGLPRLDQRPA